MLRWVGIEDSLMYRSGSTVEGGMERRKVESEWDILKQASDRFRADRPELRHISIGLVFKGPVPPRKQHQEFMQEIAAFAHNHLNALTGQDSEFWPPKFFTALMSTYLQTLYLRKDPYAEWYSDMSAG